MSTPSGGAAGGSSGPGERPVPGRGPGPAPGTARGPAAFMGGMSTEKALDFKRLQPAAAADPAPGARCSSRSR